MGRWTTEVVTGTGRRAYALLLEDVPDLREDADPQLPTPYQDPRTPVKALEDFARGLDRYALERALPDGRSPMPQVVAHFCAASALVREAGVGVALDRVTDESAVGEVERLLRVLASGQWHDLAARLPTRGKPMQEHQRLRAWRRQVPRLLAYTVCLGGIVYAVASSALGVAIASALVTAALTAWDRIVWAPGTVSGPGNRA